MAKPRVLVLTGYGINCNEETSYAFEKSGADVNQVHINEIIDGSKKFADYQILALPGGFLHGDAIAAGRIMATLLKTTMMDAVQEFIANGKPVIGICNGFQVLAKAGLLPGLDNDFSTQSVTLTYNDSGRFEDSWVYLHAYDGCIWTRGINELYLPVRHGEGKFVAKDEQTLKRLYDEDLVVLRYVGRNGEENPDYPWNPNGSVNGIAGICNPSGTILGMMPHPEGYIFRTQHPRWTREELPEDGMGLKIIRNGVAYARQL